MWARLVEPRSDAAISLDEREAWSARNAAYFVVAILGVISVGLFAAIGASWLAVGAGMATAGMAAAYALSRAGRRQLAAVVGLIPINGSIVFNTFGYGPGLVDSGYVVTVCLAFVVLEREDLPWLLVLLAGTVAPAIVGSSSLMPAPLLAPSVELERLIRAAVLALVVAAVSAVMLHFLSSRRRALARLREALAQVEAASQAKSSFLANMSHEIRTPMNGVLGMLSILEDTDIDESQREYIRTARASGMALLDVLNDVLDLSRVEGGMLVLEDTPFDLRSVIEESAQQAAAYARDKEIDVVVAYPPDIPQQLIGDAGRIRQIVVNLLNNAVKFTDRGYIAVEVDGPDEASAADPGRAGRGEPALRFRIAVADTGIGIPAAEQAAIFDKFKQVDGSTSRVHGGVGLGLAIVRELALRMGGQVGLTSQPGAGSTFWIDIPLSADPEPATSSTERVSLSALEGVRVLVVDDLPRSGEAIAMHIRHWGGEVTVSSDPTDALALLSEAHERGAPYRLVLVDRRMPEVDGFEFARTVRDASALIQPTMLVITAIHDSVREVELNAVGFAGTIRKPIVQSELARALVECWQAAQRGEPRRRRRHTSDVGEVTAPAWSGTARALVVEDNAINQKVAVRLLQKLGCRADVAANGREALELASDVPYDIIFMDVQMPEMDGLEATAALRERERVPSGEDGDGDGRPVIIAMTAHAMEEDRRRCLEAGMDGYLRKPIRQRDLARVLRRYLDAPARIHSRPG